MELVTFSMPSPIEQAIRQICDEKGLSYEAVLETIESALAAAFRKDFGDKNQTLKSNLILRPLVSGPLTLKQSWQTSPLKN
ncbi:hypothetical protein KJ910_01530 [Patescibacteria group bacterium]|nr:hypothetical protein [Patescibacteria group bacterium]